MIGSRDAKMIRHVVISTVTFAMPFLMGGCQSSSTSDAPTSISPVLETSNVDKTRGHFVSFEELAGYCMQIGTALFETDPVYKSYDETELYEQFNSSSSYFIYRSKLMEAVEGDSFKLGEYSMAGEAIRLCKYDSDAPNRTTHYEQCSWDDFSYSLDDLKSLNSACVELSESDANMSYPAYVDALFPLEVK